MKRVLLMAVAAVMLFAPAANAQKVNEAAIRQRLEKSDAEIGDPKKNEKAATWLNRAKVYFESIQTPTKDLIPGLDQLVLKTNLGDPISTEGNVWVYPWVKIHLLDGQIAWEQTKEIYPGAFEIMNEALLKAFELDPKQAAKIKSQINDIDSFYENLASVSYNIARYDVAYDSYNKICTLQSNPAYDTPNNEYYFITGQLAAFLGPEDPSKFVAGEAALIKAIDNGYTDENGDIYYYLFHCCYGQREQNPSKIMMAKDALLKGIEKFPKNEKILDGLMSLYTAEEGVGNPADLIEMIDRSLAEDPTNADLWFGRGRVFYSIANKSADMNVKLENLDECIKSFHKVVELNPASFDGNYFLSIFYQLKGEALADDVNSRDFKSQSDYDAAFRVALDTFKESVPCLEKAVEIDPTHKDAVSSLKSLCFRLRDEAPEYMEKYTKYSQMLEALQ